ncbi:CHAT domain-containing protein [Streptomyces chartreusis]|uniref:CHAT domain-containing protein n=1 Tax=Streptomyces chartreusis TaxID=1969 RepID=UPI00386DB8AD
MPVRSSSSGPQQMIAAQWPVGDTTAAVFAARFYELWRPGTQPADAFASAQRRLSTPSRSEISALSAPDLDGFGELIADLPLARAPFDSPSTGRPSPTRAPTDFVHGCARPRHSSTKTRNASKSAAPEPSSRSLHAMPSWLASRQWSTSEC